MSIKKGQSPKKFKSIKPSMFVNVGEKLVKPGDSKALSSHLANRFDLTPRNFLERIGQRFALGAEKYPPFNYRDGLQDRKFIIERINHLIEHVNSYLWPKNEIEWNDDNLAAIGWAIAFLMEVEDDPEGKQIIDEIRTERGMTGFRISK